MGDLDAVWVNAVNDLADQIISPQQRAYLQLTRLRAIVEDTALLSVPDPYTRDFIESRMRPQITDALSRNLGRPIQVAVTVRPPEDDTQRAPLYMGGGYGTPAPAAPPAPRPTPVEEPRPEIQRALSYPSGAYPPVAITPPPDGEDALFAVPTQPVPREPAHDGAPESGPGRVGSPSASAPSISPAEGRGPLGGRPPAPETGGNRLNPKYMFETFVIGSSNRFAHAAAVAVAESPAKAYNPLFIYGGSGLGKTHLLHAIGHYAQQLGNARGVRYVSTEEFTNDFINSLRDDKQSAFQRRYRDVDILLIDDIQFLENRERTQEEFFHTFNTLHNANKQIVITSDRSPKQLATLEDRLRTRFEWGLLADIQPPDLETRIAILQKKAAQDRLFAPPEVLEFVASRISNSIRELEGALIRVTAYASLSRSPVSLQIAEEVLRDFIPDGTAPEITADQIMVSTADYFGVSLEDLRGHSRSRVLVNARQVAMYLCRELTAMSLPRIGSAFGGRDHTTVMHAERKIRQQMAERRSLYNQIAELTNRIKQTP
ncbi:chromosomal replication initiator protein [Hamadaea flava]|uniref:Chromosomal replication initiator protein DnaA n=1 Tax=Hamadaea flava TaxID=1742688 RepID=A0ABV8LFU0_9ACTN|nr:chromosomal replication initiator protein DnaA [Hamadaea flava]MCP2326073.1 chromosomal replication initiator protein [Hamadaea flava]